MSDFIGPLDTHTHTLILPHTHVHTHKGSQHGECGSPTPSIDFLGFYWIEFFTTQTHHRLVSTRFKIKGETIQKG